MCQFWSLFTFYGIKELQNSTWHIIGFPNFLCLKETKLWQVPQERNSQYFNFACSNAILKTDLQEHQTSNM